jgi:hypothetical protein
MTGTGISVNVGGKLLFNVQLAGANGLCSSWFLHPFAAASQALKYWTYLSMTQMNLPSNTINACQIVLVYGLAQFITNCSSPP